MAQMATAWSFSLSVTGGTPKVLASFDDLVGRYPQAGLTLSGNTLYGTAATFGPGDDGTVFSIPVTGGTPTVLASFNNSDGASLGSGLTLFGGTLYGTARFGGDDGDGTVFSVPITGGTPTVLASLDGSNGEEPEAGLALSDNTLYGTTFGGGAGNDGTVFKITGAVVTPAISLKAPSNQAATAGTAASLALGSFSETNATAPYTDTINWGDGSANTVLKLGSAGTIPATVHTFAKAGTLTVSETITDANGDASNTATFNVVVSPASLPASKLAFAASPSGATAGKALGSVVVDVENSAGPVVTSDSSTVTLGIVSGPSGAKLGGTVSVTANKGIATFSNLLLDTAGTYVLKATDGSLASSNTTSFTVVPAAAAKVVFTQALGNSTAGKTISPSVTVKVEDAFGNLETTDKSTVKLAVATGPSGGTLLGTTSVTASAGVATFGSLLLDVAGTYTLKATDGTLAAASTVAFSVIPATAAKLVFSTVPSKAVHNTAFTVKNIDRRCLRQSYHDQHHQGDDFRRQRPQRRFFERYDHRLGHCGRRDVQHSEIQQGGEVHAKSYRRLAGVSDIGGRYCILASVEG